MSPARARFESRSISPAPARCSSLLLVLGLTLIVGHFGAAPALAASSCLDSGADCSLREVAAESGRLVGSATSTQLLAAEPIYAETLVREFSSITAENQMKWSSVQPTRGVFDFSGGDALVDFADANAMSVHGHALVWNQANVDSTPDWVEAITDPTELRGVLENHIETVMGHYAGRVRSWDVVNEPLVNAGTTVFEGHFHDVLGPGFIADAFEMAHAADPTAELFLNEIGTLFFEDKFDAFYTLVSDLLTQGVPLHGVGLQGHFVVPSITTVDRDVVRSRIEAFADLGLIVEITELDIGLGTGTGALQQQGDHFFQVASACVAVAACRRITTWGFTDAHTWYDTFFSPDLDPLLFDDQYVKKPAYDGFRSGLATGIVPEPGTALLVGIGLLMLSRRSTNA